MKTMKKTRKGYSTIRRLVLAATMTAGLAGMFGCEDGGGSSSTTLYTGRDASARDFSNGTLGDTTEYVEGTYTHGDQSCMTYTDVNPDNGEGGVVWLDDAELCVRYYTRSSGGGDDTPTQPDDTPSGPPGGGS